MKRTITLALIAGLALVATTTEVGRVLALGWISYLRRVVPNVQVDWPSIGVGVFAFSALVLLVDRFGRFWRRSKSEGTWRISWTLSLVGILIVLFAAGISITAIAHQSIWLARSDESLLIRRISPSNMAEKSKTLSDAFVGYHDTYRTFPAGGTFRKDGRMLHSWETRLLPYLGHYWDAKLNHNEEWYLGTNGQICKTIVIDFIRPNSPASDLRDDDGFGLSHFSVNSNVLSANRSMKLSEISNGGSNTLLVGEVNSGYRAWGDPVNWRDPAIGINHPQGFGGTPASGGAIFVLADGSVRFISNHISPDVLKAMSLP